MTGSALPTALVVDWGGVLTPSLEVAMAEWARTEAVDYAHFRAVMSGWVGPVGRVEGAGQVEGASPVHRLERGELAPTGFEEALAAELAARGSVVAASGLLSRLLGGLATLEDDMVALVRRARAAGVATALLSNSWGDHYPDELWDGVFDAVVISGRVGMRKPEARIFRHTAQLLGVPTTACVMVDDLAHNVAAAVRAGMVGVLHRSYEETVTELEAVFDLPLR